MQEHFDTGESDVQATRTLCRSCADPARSEESRMRAGVHVPISNPVRGLDVIVPIYKNAELVRICVESLLTHFNEIEPYKPRLVLINDSPGDVEIEGLLGKYGAAQALVLSNQENLGFVRSVNRGLSLAQRDRHDVLLVNSDTQTFSGTLLELLKGAKTDPQIGFASPRSNNASICSLPHSFGSSATPEESYARWKVISRTMPAYHFTPTAVGFYLFISYSVLAEHGHFRENFGLGYEEENDLVMRAGKVGTRAIMVNHSFAYHAGSASFNLTDLDLGNHKHQNLLKLSGDHPEFLPLVKRYETSPHYRAESLMAGLLRDSDGRIKVAFDLTGMGQHFNGTNEQTVAVLRSIAKRHSDRIKLSGVAPVDSFGCHGLDKIEGLHREDPGAPGLHGIAVRLAQPYALRHMNYLESLAPVNLFAMLDTISEDCGPLALDGEFLELWDHVAEHANGLIFTSKFTEQTFCNRHSAARAVPRWQCLLPTRLSSYAKPHATSKDSHVLVVGNHFAHKGSDVAARTIAAAFPTLRVVVLGSETMNAGNVTGYRAGLIEPAEVDSLFRNSSIVVLPSHVEGFGFGFMHALAVRRPIVARRIRATEEILATLDDVEGVFLFDHSADLVQACTQALQAEVSRAKDDRGNSWDDWADGLAEFCLSLLDREDVFDRLVHRLKAGDRLRRAARYDVQLRDDQAAASEFARAPTALSNAKAVDLSSLLTLDGHAFVEHAYATLLGRPVDGEGLSAYLSQLELGAHKVDLLHALATSSEGRLRDVELPGLDQVVAQLRQSHLPWFKRLFVS
ncbi:MAG TPA: glycosyltransferase [Steroidobacteraceae bacterium]|nr:glycosyltransferase [Steroidobacteraceae bacterium]